MISSCGYISTEIMEIALVAVIPLYQYERVRKTERQGNKRGREREEQRKRQGNRSGT